MLLVLSYFVCCESIAIAIKHNPVPALDRDTYLSPGSVYVEKSLDFGTVF